MKLRVVAAFAVCLLALASPNLFAQAGSGGLSPDKAEIESASSAGIVFVSYEGPSTRIDALLAVHPAGTGAKRGSLRGAAGASPHRRPSGDPHPPLRPFGAPPLAHVR